ncbi:MAG: alpha/beta fold hydrolase [Cellvibrionaceae bacterium]|nr:alpha/beta fold hydrolase [Cellvibrionaceae bacterium]
MKMFTPSSGGSRYERLGCLRRFRPRSKYARCRIVMFPCAGAGASSFRALSLALPTALETWVVQLPGREDRLSEALGTSMQMLLPEIAAAVLQLPGDRPLILFGHSMGSLLAYETAHLLWSQRPIYRLIVSGLGAPCVRPSTQRCHHAASNEALLADMARLGGTPHAILSSPVLMKSYLPVLRADYQLLEDYRPLANASLACAIEAYAGDSDPEVSAEALLAWQRHTQQPLKHTWFKGDHFYYQDNLQPLVNALSQHV